MTSTGQFHGKRHGDFVDSFEELVYVDLALERARICVDGCGNGRELHSFNINV